MSVNLENQSTYPLKRKDAWVSDDIYGLYLHDIKKYPVLEKEEVSLLAKRVQHGISAQEILDNSASEDCSDIEAENLLWAVNDGMQARNSIVAANTGLVMMWAKRQRGRGIEFEDLVQAGNIGLIRAAEKFDPDTGFAFSTYASRWIQAFVEREVHEHGRMISIPREESQALSKHRRISQEHMVITGKHLSKEEMAKEMGRTVSKMDSILSMEKQVVSINISVDDNNDLYWYDYAPDRDIQPEYEQVIDAIQSEANSSAIHELLVNSSLDDDHIQVVRMYFGLETGESMTQNEIADKLGCGRKKIASMINLAVATLRHEAEKSDLRYVTDVSINVNE